MRTDWGATLEAGQVELERQLGSLELVARFSPFSDERSAADAQNKFLNLHNMLYPLRALGSAQRFGPIVEIFAVFPAR